jgi:cytochrome c5
VEAHEHTSFIKTPQQLVVVILLSFILPVVVIVLLVKLVLSQPHADPGALKPDAVTERIRPVGSVEFGTGGVAKGAAKGSQVAAAGKKAGPMDGKTVYEKTCSVCHTAGVAGAPKPGDKAAWAPRLKQGMPALVQAVIKGKGAMPPKGGNAALSDAEVRAAVDFVVSQSK